MNVKPANSGGVLVSHAISVQHGAFGRAALYRLDRGFVTHAHREGHLIFHISGAPAIVTVNGVPITVDPINFAAVSPWEPHSFDIGPSGEASQCLVLYIRPDWFAEMEAACNGLFRFGRSHLKITPDAARWVHRLGDMLAAQEVLDEAKTCLFEVASRCHHLSWRGLNPADCEAFARNPDKRVSRALGIMDEHFTEDVEMEWLARESGLSRPHFFKLFKHDIGVTPNIYLNTLRSEQAIDELLDTVKSVAEIGYDLGFSSQASFTRFFSANVGVPPSDYRRVALSG